MLILIILELILHIPLVGMVIAGFMSQLELACSFGCNTWPAFWLLVCCRNGMDGI
ncbi:hypothetical protein AKJ16_DCAP15498 [Drosera capensis]